MATGMDRLRFMQGEWDVTADVMGPDGNWISIELPNETMILPINSGVCHSEEMPVLVDGEETRLFFSWSWDKYRQTYRMLSCDDTSGVMSVLEGNFIEGTNTVVINDVNTGTAFPGNNDQKPYYRQLASTKDSEDAFTDIVSESYDGLSWFPVFRAIHIRK